jgi:hypothetical protein
LANFEEALRYPKLHKKQKAVMKPERAYPQLFDDEHDIELAAGFWSRKHEPWIAIAAIAVSLLAALTAVYWMPLLPPA